MTADTLTRPKGGAPRGNRNSMKHGLRGSGLPKGCTYLEGQLTAFRRYVRAELEQIHGDVSFLHEAYLQSAVRHEQRALLVARWLRIEDAKLTIDQKAGLLRDLSSATDSRDRCLNKLGLEKGDGDIIQALYASSSLDARTGIDATDEASTEPDALEREFGDESE